MDSDRTLKSLRMRSEQTGQDETPTGGRGRNCAKKFFEWPAVFVFESRARDENGNNILRFDSKGGPRSEGGRAPRTPGRPPAPLPLPLPHHTPGLPATPPPAPPAQGGRLASVLAGLGRDCQSETSMIVYPPSPSGRSCKRTVQWRHTNVQDGLVRTDPEMLSKLISTESLHKYYKLDPTPFAKWSYRYHNDTGTQKIMISTIGRRTLISQRFHDTCREREQIETKWDRGSQHMIKYCHTFKFQNMEAVLTFFSAPGGDMQTLIDDNLVPFEKDVVKYVHDVVEALAYLHHRKIAHLDIKPQNLVMMGEFPDCEIKVCDFEISRVVLDGTEVHEILGTPEYVGHSESQLMYCSPVSHHLVVRQTRRPSSIFPELKSIFPRNCSKTSQKMLRTLSNGFFGAIQST
ncbi:unnamed protein product [Nesidiocoris tenuis]|uniref:Protein kinase domain-containing protein n=1 Tax=Nesidiocoris tenuis TaxID=355587 RepID=A0A6H5G5B7_9HEMI|nr:unnamed protein product [Nesidiocoris tenuis]